MTFLRPWHLELKGVGFTTSVITAVSAGDSEGVEQLVGFINGELKRTMAACGSANLSAVNSLFFGTLP